MSENGQVADKFIINKSNAISSENETKTTAQAPVTESSIEETFEINQYVAKTVPLDYDDSDVYCTCCDYAWRPKTGCIAFGCVFILCIIFIPLAVIRPAQSKEATIVPTAAPNIDSDLAIVDEHFIQTPSEEPSKGTDIPKVPVAAPVAMPASSSSPTDGETTIVTVAPTSVDLTPSTDVPTPSFTTITNMGLNTIPPLVTDMPTPPTTTSPPTHSPTSFPTEPSLTLTPSGDVISDAAPPGSQFGYTVSLSHDGNILSVGAPLYENKGMVRAYTLSSDQWQQLGTDSYGDETDDRYGWSTPLSANGLVMATSGGLGGGGIIPYVRVYNNISPNMWSPKGDDLTGDFGFGNSVSLSADGGRIAVGAKKDVSVFEYDDEGDKWDLMGVLTVKYASVALSESGYILAVGGPYASDVYKEGGVVNVWEYEGGESWSLRGGVAAMYGNDAMEKFGYSVSISNDGGVVAAGSLEGNYVKVSKFSDGSWMPYGEEIHGEEDDRQKFGFKVALSGDAERLVVGSPLYKDYNGRSVVYSFNNKEQSWDNVMDVVGINRNDQEGYAVAMSSDGSSIASSALNANNGAGRVRVFNLQ